MNSKPIYVDHPSRFLATEEKKIKIVTIDGDNITKRKLDIPNAIGTYTDLYENNIIQIYIKGIQVYNNLTT